ncbi:B-cell receptor CD22-like [Hydractinia symbiolongicarpus]|uniref:B-cell receptor CD22-like n=1 Tax=Hydractinia symbiolongicarpus TaxID=13093 RepID=UPI00254EB3A6|nr:B-cell receptor CD22-like [Hydractinia symbiolongicarpus]
MYRNLFIVGVVYFLAFTQGEQQLKPKIVIEDGSNPIVEGERLALVCNVSSCNKDCRKGWRTPTERVIREHITIPRIEKRNSGKYSCALIVNNTIKEQSDELDVIVFYIDKPTIVITPSLVIEEGSDVTINCSTNDSYPTVFAYEIIGKNQSTVVLDKLTSLQQFKLSATLAHDGNYSCLAKNGKLTKKSDDIILKVKKILDTPKVILHSENLSRINTPVTIHCMVTSTYPNLTFYRWFKDDKIIQNMRTSIHISSLETTDQGTYQCEAWIVSKNVIKKSKPIMLKVHVDIKITPQNITEVEGTTKNPRLSCIVRKPKYESMRYQWEFNGKVLPDFDPPIIPFPAKDFLRVVEGTYRCLVNIGTQYQVKSHLAFVKVLRIDSPKLSHYKSSSENILFCEQNDTALKLTTNWYKNGKKLNVPSSEQLKLSNNEGFVGEYRCGVTDAGSILEKKSNSVNLKYEDPVDPPESLPLTEIISAVIAVLVIMLIIALIICKCRKKASKNAGIQRNEPLYADVPINTSPPIPNSNYRPALRDTSASVVGNPYVNSGPIRATTPPLQGKHKKLECTYSGLLHRDVVELKESTYAGLNLESHYDPVSFSDC